MKLSHLLGGAGVALGAVAVRDLTRTRHALLRSFPGGRPRALPAGAGRARAAAVHRHQQRRGAALQPRPARLAVGSPARLRPVSVVNISGMSYGSLSGPAITALNRGAAEAGCLRDTGEGGLSPYHQQGGDLVPQIGTSCFGYRTPDGEFSLEITLSRGAEPGLGPAAGERDLGPEQVTTPS